MEPLPLIPKISNLSNHDVTHVLREAFQDLLGEEAFPKNIARNMEKYNLKMQELKDNAMQANLLPRDLEQKLTDVTLVEEHLFLQQAKYFITKDSIIKDPRINELSKLKPLKLTDHVSDTFVNKFGLITREDILPPLPERALDFRLNSNRHLCETCEPEMKFTPPIKMFKEPQAAITTLSKSRRRQIGEKVFFEAMPKQIVFNDYELNVTYTHVSDNIELVVGAFRFYPAYFEVKENEFAEVVLSFYPKRYGLFVETIYLLCNNNTYEELDFMGDGVYFEKSFITFDLKKKDSKPFFLDYESEYCLHLGKCLACTKHKGFIRVFNSRLALR
ncbi:hypothetical protein AMK59_7469 [Oryctes borbonicus]|uniref:Uncharacterized protein n=1 Tax=Oryctes borbonicus TaxID=1629725 RepID=A0A0T6AWM4_9SCAR|nr:hypothetical protein AMK59_7469 [Oryctes borbonicus]